jgi:hypothetical protein
MRELEIWFKKTGLIVNIEEKTSFHSKQMRVLLRPQIMFKNIELTYQSELRFLRVYITENQKWGTHARLLRAKLSRVV